jgi:leader peptidase (prepilin peptidase)/N-methyltransferase
MSQPSVPHLLVLFVVSIPIVISDIRSYRIPDILSVGGLAAALLLSVALSLVQESWEPVVAGSAGSAAAFVCFFAISVLMPGKLGFGDVKFAAFLGACLGPPLWIVATFVAASSGIAAFAFASSGFRRRARDMRIAFAPFMAAGAILVGVVARAVPGWVDLLSIELLWISTI